MWPVPIYLKNEPPLARAMQTRPFFGSQMASLTLILTAWVSVATGADAPHSDEALRLVPVHPLAKVLQSAGFPSAAAPKLQLDAAKGETVSGQVVLVPGRGADAVVASLSELRHATERDATISRSCARLQWVRYVQVSTNTADIPTDELVARAPVSLPDPF